MFKFFILPIIICIIFIIILSRPQIQDTIFSKFFLLLFGINIIYLIGGIGITLYYEYIIWNKQQFLLTTTNLDKFKSEETCNNILK